MFCCKMDYFHQPITPTTNNLPMNNKKAVTPLIAATLQLKNSCYHHIKSFFVSRDVSFPNNTLPNLKAFLNNKKKASLAALQKFFP